MVAPFEPVLFKDLVEVSLDLFDVLVSSGAASDAEAFV